ncbi:MAG: hypothetical protein R3299_13820, partial [Arenibacter sp.]|nr:hypothetical protein [Arenibacter sp.]
YHSKNIRNWLIPFVAIIAMLLISMAVLVVLGNPNYLLDHYKFQVTFNASYFGDYETVAFFLLYVLVILLSGFMGYIRLGKVGLGWLMRMRLVLYIFLVGLLITFFKSSSDNYPIIITFFPAVIFMTTYVETIKKERIRELVLITTIILPFIVLLARIF